ncbi:hypothetical protein [Halorubrum sp. Eb13]|uniref:DUF7344 domain-containing protein n=1 Tax=Halorubrum sp. Eb13 TaxID=1383843 RepID=UPI000B97E3B9|nr:hypothetical protein [Halorubrum sp. Eb13]OYR43557.1 hypothetical protein DJ75_11680 [Halorubrum sp. Eb13]
MSGVTGPRNADEELTADTCLTLLSNAHRRAVLLTIYDRVADDVGDEPVPVEETVDGSIPEPVEMSLNHNHLPKLAEHDVVRWDREAGTVVAGSAFSRIEPFIARLDGDRERLPNDWRPDIDR